MLSPDLVRPEQVAMLVRVLDAHCQERGIQRGSGERADAACLMMQLFQDGYRTAERLADALNRRWVADQKHRLSDAEWGDGVPRRLRA
jgi:hypothetical protein